MIVIKKVFDLITKRWIELPFETDPSRVEPNIPGEKKLKATGLYKGMKTKSFSEMTEEEQKLFIDNNDSEEGSLDGQTEDI